MADSKTESPAIILAAFGTSEPMALQSILNIENKMRKEFPEAQVWLAFTSSIIRRIWRKRADNASFRAANPEVPGYIYQIHAPLATMALAVEEGPRPIVLQSLHINNGEEFNDLSNMASQMAGINYVRTNKSPFKQLALGRSALGDGTEADLLRAAQALAPLADEADRAGASLLLMGHGSTKISNQIYVDFETVLRRLYGPKIYIGLVEGNPDFEDALKRLTDDRQKNGHQVMLAPLMLVAGDHARNDMAGAGDESWASRLKNAEFSVTASLQGLGNLDSWAEIYSGRVRELLGGLLKN